MKAEIEISLKDGILDPQAKTIFNALHSFGFDCVKDFKITKKMILDLDLNDAKSCAREVRINGKRFASKSRD